MSEANPVVEAKTTSSSIVNNDSPADLLTPPDIIKVAISKLSLSPDNMRMSKKIDSDFVDSIYENGLIQAITITKDDQVVGGRRRYLALRKLVDTKKITDDFLVPCVRVDNDKALHASIIENLHRRSPHPSQYYAAIKRLSNIDNYNKASICKKLQIAGDEYDQFMRLANLHPRILSAYAKDDLNAAQVKAFGATDNKKLQIEIWERSELSVSITPHQIKQQIYGELTSESPLVVFAGLDEYKKRSGRLTVDLFENVSTILDAPLLKTIVEEKLVKHAEEYAGKHPDWKWVKHSLEPRSDDMDIKNTIHPKYKARTKDEDAALEKINAKLEKLEELDEFNEKQRLQFDKLEQQYQDLEKDIDTKRTYFTKAEMRLSGVVVTIDHSGAVSYEHGQQTSEDVAAAKAKAKKTKDKAAAQHDENDSTPATPSTSFSQALQEDFNRYRLAMVKAQLIKNPELALDLLNYSTIVSLLGNYTISSIHNVRLSETNIETSIDDIESTAMHKVITDASKSLDLDWLEKKSEVDRITAYIALKPAVKSKILTYVSAMTLVGDTERFIASTTKLNQRDYFTPTSENYFQRISKPLLLEQYKSITDEEPTTEMLAAKKPSLVETLSSLFKGKKSNKTWIPEILK